MSVVYPKLDSLWDALKADWGVAGSYGEGLEGVESDIEHATHGLAALETLVDDLETRMSAAWIAAYTVARAAYLDELAAANIPADVDTLKTNCDKRVIGRAQVLEVSITAAANAGVTTIATVTSQPCVIEGIILHADAAQTADLTSAAIKGGVGQVVEFISATDAAQANLNAADKQVGWTGAVRFAAAKTVVVDLQGTGVTAVDLTVVIVYRASADGGYLA